MAEKPITLTVTSPDHEAVSVRCDSVRLTVPDSRDGNIPGGSVGIRRGHMPALIAVAPGIVRAYAEGREIFACETSGGLATVGGDRVTLATGRFTETEQP